MILRSLPLLLLLLTPSTHAKDDVDRLMDTVQGFIYGINSKVVEYNDDTFKEGMAQHDTAFVEFVAPWCPHCKRLMPDFERAAKVLDKNNIPVTFVKVNCDGPGYHTCADAKCDIYPTLKLYRNGVEERRYLGERTPKDLVRYALNMIGDHAKKLANKEEVAKFTVSDSEYMFVGSFPEETELSREFLAQAEKLREFYRFGIVTDPTLVGGEKNVVLAYQPEFLRNKWESHKKVFNGDPFDLESFIQAARVDLVGIIDRNNHEDFEARRPLIITTFDVDFEVNKKRTNYVRNRLLKAASEYKDKVAFTMGGLNMTHYYAPDDRYNDTGVVMTVIDEEGWEYTVPKEIEFTFDNLKQVVEDVISGKIKGKPYREEEAPVQKKRVKRVVSSTFKDYVLNPDVHSLIEFYSPYCGHCKALIPLYNELASRAREEKGLVIAKMDATANSLPRPFNSRGFPTIYFVPKGKSVKPIKFEGDRTIEGFIEFMQKHTKEELKFVEPEEKYLKKKGEEAPAASGTCGGDTAATGAGGEGQCSAGKQEL